MKPAERSAPTRSERSRFEASIWRSATGDSRSSPARPSRRTLTDREERLYRTGDLGVMRPDGCLTHLGRKDFQIKIRGYRVEVTAVEDALLDLASIEAAVVQALADDAGEQRLVAYVVPALGTDPKVNELRRELAKTLPDYMVPSAFVFLPRLSRCRSPARSIDEPCRRRVASGRPSTTSSWRPGISSRTSWPRSGRTLLNLETVGIHDNFLDLGGHSLLAAQVLSRVRDTFQVELPLAALFEAPTVAGLAESVGAARSGRPGPAGRRSQAHGPGPAAPPLLRSGADVVHRAARASTAPSTTSPPSFVSPVPSMWRCWRRASTSSWRVTKSCAAASPPPGSADSGPGATLSLSLPVVDLRGSPTRAQGAATLISQRGPAPLPALPGPLAAGSACCGSPTPNTCSFS